MALNDWTTYQQRRAAGVTVAGGQSHRLPHRVPQKPLTVTVERQSTTPATLRRPVTKAPESFLTRLRQLLSY
jgi:hypothetical protein